MTLHHLLPFISTGIIFLFTAAVFQRYLKGRKPHSLMWSIGLTLYGLGTLSEAYLALAWHPLWLKLWYVTGAMLTAAWLGQGTVFLLVRRPGVANQILIGLLMVSVASVGLVSAAPLNETAFQLNVPLSSQYRAILLRDELTIILTVVLNIYGTLTLVGGAAWSAWLFLRKQVLPHRVVGNLCLAVGALFPASAGTLIRLGLGDWLYLSELLGAAVMFLGFWLATQTPRVEQSVVEPAVLSSPNVAQ